MQASNPSCGRRPPRDSTNCSQLTTTEKGLDLKRSTGEEQRGLNLTSAEIHRFVNYANREVRPSQGSRKLRQQHPRTSKIPRSCCARDSGGRCQAPCVCTSGAGLRQPATATVPPRDLGCMAPKHETGDGKLASATLEEVEIFSSERAVKTSSSTASPAVHSSQKLSGVHVPRLSATTKKVMAAWSVSLLSLPAMRNNSPSAWVGCQGSHTHPTSRNAVSVEKTLACFCGCCRTWWSPGPHAGCVVLCHASVGA